MGLSPCRLVVPVKGSKRSRLPLPWGHVWSFPGFVVFKNNSRVIITHSRRQGQAPCSGGRTFPSAAPTLPCAFRDVPGTAPSLQHLRPTWAASCPVLPLRTRLCRSFVRAVGSHPSRKPAARRRQRFPAPCGPRRAFFRVLLRPPRGVCGRRTGHRAAGKRGLPPSPGHANAVQDHSAQERTAWGLAGRRRPSCRPWPRRPSAALRGRRAPTGGGFPCRLTRLPCRGEAGSQIRPSRACPFSPVASQRSGCWPLIEWP